MADGKPRYISYEKYGAKGDGVTDDLPAIVAAHKAANELGLPVRARRGATYYIGGENLTATIKTDTYWGQACFIIDDRAVENRRSPVFRIEPSQKAFPVKGVKSLCKGQDHLGVSLPERCLVCVTDDSTKVYIRSGGNVNSGTSKSELFIAEKDGAIAGNTPVVWDYGQITSIEAYPIDRKTLHVSGGRFTTIANQDPAKYNYYWRGIIVNRSNVVIEGVSHTVVGEPEDHGAPYSAFLEIDYAAEVTVKDCRFCARRTYETIGAAGTTVKMGSYDIQAKHAADVCYKSCTQERDIDDDRYWGLFASNFCKDLKMDGCRFSRFDAHMGVCNVTLTGCTFGHQGVRMVGSGRLYLDGCEVRDSRLVHLRSDYGSTWDGVVVVRDCILHPVKADKSLSLIDGVNTGLNDYGYDCCLPSLIDIHNLVIDDALMGDVGPNVFSPFRPNSERPGLTSLRAEGDIILDGITVKSGKQIGLSENPALFKHYRVTVSGGTGFAGTVCGEIRSDRLDDLVWENEFSGYRAFGPALQANGEHNYGYDIFTKSVFRPVVHERYEKALGPEKISFHLDHGDGMDSYGVGPTLGCGTTALVDSSGNIVYPWCWKESEILENGPRRFQVRLTYSPVVVNGLEVVEHRLITLDSGRRLNHVEVSYDGLDAPCPIVVGIVVHAENPNGYYADDTVIATADLGDRNIGNNGEMYCGAVLPGGFERSGFEAFKEPRGAAIGHVLGYSTYVPGKPFIYYFGSGWSKAGISSLNEWIQLIRDKDLEIQ